MSGLYGDKRRTYAYRRLYSDIIRFFGEEKLAIYATNVVYCQFAIENTHLSVDRVDIIEDYLFRVEGSFFRTFFVNYSTLLRLFGRICSSRQKFFNILYNAQCVFTYIRIPSPYVRVGKKIKTLSCAWQIPSWFEKLTQF